MARFKTTIYQIQLHKPNLTPGSFRAVFLSDLHNVEIGPGNAQLLEAVRAAEPDLILCGGDMIVGKPGMCTEPASEFLKRLSEIGTVYFAPGNHEYRTQIYPETYPGMYEQFRTSLADADLIWLENSHIRRQIRGLSVCLYGLMIDRIYYARFKHSQLPLNEMRSMLGSPDPDAVNLVLAHNPAHMKTYLEWGGDLTLCGHYHGGMVRFGKHRGLLCPDLRPFSAKAYGHHERKGRHVVIGAGLGEHTVPIRIRNPRELVVLDISIL